MHAYALNVLSEGLKPGSKVLDVGSGSGYLTACLAYMIGDGKVVGIDHFEELVNFSIENICKNNESLLETGRLRIEVADGFEGFEEEAPYDCIHVGCAAPEIPKALLDQLAPNGFMMIPVGPEGGA